MSAKGNAAKLLDMLKSATSPPPANPAPSGQPSSSLSPSSGSPREPSPVPPPPSLQAVTLQDLFAGLTAAPSNPAISQPPPNVQSSQPDRSASLMGILNGIGGQTSNGNVSQNGNGIRENALSPSPGQSTPGSFGTIGGENGKPVQHQVNLLNMFKSPSTTSTPRPAQPVIDHPTGVPSAPATPSIASTAQSGQPSPSIVPSGLQNSSSEQIQASKLSEPTGSQPPIPQETAKEPQAAPISVPSRSIFDFVSPFDAFEKPKSKGGPQKAQSPAPPQAPTKPTAASPVPASVPSPSSKESKALPQLHNQSQRPQQLQSPALSEVRQRQPSGTGSNASSSHGKDNSLPWTLNKVISKGTQGAGPKTSGKYISIDLSKANVDSLVNAPGVSQVIPTTILKQDNVGFSKGRSVALTASWLAYAMTKGRVRLIDMNSGARLMIPPTSGQSGIIDLAATSERLAVLYSDRSIAVFKVPASWSDDNPNFEVMVTVPVSESNTEGLGSVNRVEWVRKEGDHHLIIGGDQGVLIIKPSAYNEEQEISLPDLEKGKILKTEGPVAAFCINHSHQAIGLLSTKGQLTLYNVTNLARVWNRPLPSSSSKASVPSSVHFVESNILVGRDNNTQFDLVQITTEIAVLSIIRFTSPAPSPPHLHFAQVIYDSPRNTLYIAPFSRGTLFGFRYALKGQPPIKISESPDKIAFDKMAEYPLEPVLSLVLSPKPVSEDAELFFATASGFSIVHIDRSAGENLSAKAVQVAVTDDASSVPAASTGLTVGASDASTDKQVTPDIAVPDKSEAAKDTNTPVKNSSVLPAVAKVDASQEIKTQSKEVFNIDEDGVNKLLKRSEDKIANNLKQVLNHQLGLVNNKLDAMSSGELAETVAARVEANVKAVISTSVQAEIKKSMQSVSSDLHREVQSALASTVPTTVSAALQNTSSQLERALVPHIQRVIGSAIQGTVDRAVSDVFQQRLAPLVQAECAAANDRLSAEIKSELLHVRKDLAPRGEASTETLVKSLAATIGDLQKQVASLSEQVARQSSGQSHSGHTGGPFNPTIPAMAVPPPVPVAQHPLPKPMPPQQVLEDSILTVLSSQNTPALIAMVNDHWIWTESILPAPPARSPLSQAVILTLSHRLAITLSEINPTDINFSRLLHWERRVVALLDRSAPETAAFYPRVLPVVQGTLANVFQSLQRGGFGGDLENLKALKSILDILLTKM